MNCEILYCFSGLPFGLLDDSALLGWIQSIIDELPDDSYGQRGVSKDTPVSGILYLEAQGNYTCVERYNDSKLVVSKLLKDVENELPDDPFYRVNRRYVINLNYINAPEQWLQFPNYGVEVLVSDVDF